LHKHASVNEIKNVRTLKEKPTRNTPKRKFNKIIGLTPTQKHAFARKFANFSSLMGLGGSLRASRVKADELKYCGNVILNAGDALEVAMSCSFSKLRSGESEFRV
jgi:hypothetical protein